jgi:single-strand DNA-binding protein
MANFNKVILVGNLTRDPQLKQLANNSSVVEFGLAVNHRYRTSGGDDREETMFIDVAAFGKAADVINQYCQKGKQLMIEGRLKFDTWEDKQGGGRRSKHSVVVDNFQFIGGRDGQSTDRSTDQTQEERPRRDGGQNRRPQRQQRPAPTNSDPYGDHGDNFSEDDIPF